MVDAIRGLITGDLTGFTERFLMKPVAVGVELAFGKILVIGYLIERRNSFSFIPGFGFDAKTLDIGMIIEMTR